MGVTKVWQNLTSQSNHGELDEHADRTYLVTWGVKTDDPKDGVQVVGDAPGLPRLRQTYVFGNDRDIGSVVQRISPKRHSDDPTFWTVEIEYRSRVEIDAQREERDPIARPPEKEWSTDPYQMATSYDRFGNLIANTAHEVFDPPVMKDDDRLTLRYMRNEQAVDIPFIFSYRGCVNSDTFQGFRPGECKLSRIQSRRQVENAIEFWETSYEFHFRNTITTPQAQFYKPAGAGWQLLTEVPPWNLNLQNVSFHEKVFVPGGAEWRPIPGAKQPVRLWINGTRMPVDTPRDETVYLSFEIYEMKPFAPLGIV